MRKNDTLSPTAAPRRRSGHGDRRTSNFFFAGITPAAAQSFRIGAGKWGGALEGLVAAGLGRWENIQPGPKGGRPTEVFRLHTAPGDDIAADPGSVGIVDGDELVI